MVATRSRDGPLLTPEGWLLTDDTGSLPLLAGGSIAQLLAISAGDPVDVTVEWTPHGVVPLAIHLAPGHAGNLASPLSGQN